MGTSTPTHKSAGRLNANLQFVSLAVHGALVALVILCTFALAYQRILTADAVLGIFGSVVGFSGGAAAYRSGVRQGDTQPRNGASDTTG